MKNKKFDERQLLIRGQIAFHGILLMLVLVLINGILQDNKIVWATGFDQSLLIVIVTVMLVSIEAILRGAFFGQRQTHWPMIVIYGVCAVVIIAVYGTFFLEGATFMENGRLAVYGANILTGFMLAITTIIGVCKELSDHREKHE